MLHPWQGAPLRPQGPSLTEFAQTSAAAPAQDLLFPQLREPSHYKDSPLLGAAAQPRTLLVFFRASAVNVHHTQPLDSCTARVLCYVAWCRVTHALCMHYAHYALCMLCTMQGDMGVRREHRYSRGIRQKLYRASLMQNWKAKYNIVRTSPAI